MFNPDKSFLNCGVMHPFFRVFPLVETWWPALFWEKRVGFLSGWSTTTDLCACVFKASWILGSDIEQHMMVDSDEKNQLLFCHHHRCIHWQNVRLKCTPLFRGQAVILFSMAHWFLSFVTEILSMSLSSYLGFLPLYPALEFPRISLLFSGLWCLLSLLGIESRALGMCFHIGHFRDTGNFFNRIGLTASTRLYGA